MKTHQHRKRTESEPRCYQHPVAWPENQAAHGNIVVRQVCRCGATRSVNINGVAREVGPWTEVAR